MSSSGKKMKKKGGGKPKVQMLSFGADNDDGDDAAGGVIDLSSLSSQSVAHSQRNELKRKKQEVFEMEEKRARRELNKKAKKYERGERNVLKGTGTDKKLRTKVRNSERAINEAVMQAARAEIILPTEAGSLEADGLESTWQYSQKAMRANVDKRTQKKMFDLKLPTLGPYTMDYTRNGRHLLLGGRKGHLALMDWTTHRLVTEIHVRETVRDVQLLQNHTMFAVAQKKYMYIYDNNGIELHCLRNHVEPNRLEFLPYHYLVVSIGKAGFLKYQDVSTGQLVAEWRTKLGECKVMCQNPHNAIVHLGHSNGQVTFWSPNLPTPHVKMLTHKGPVQAIAFDKGGYHMVTSGIDGQVNVWDIRTYRKLHSYFSVRPASTIDISHTGMLALGFGPHVQVWKDALTTKQKAPYVVHQLSGKNVQNVQFCPYEDILGVSHSQGFSTVLVPGAGEANFDSFEANPFETKTQRQETTVRSLLEKLQPDMISLDADAIGKIDQEAKGVQLATPKAADKPKKEKNRMRGRSKSSKRWLRRRKNVVDQAKMERQEKIAKIHQERKKAKEERIRKEQGVAKNALDRFSGKQQRK